MGEDGRGAFNVALRRGRSERATAAVVLPLLHGPTFRRPSAGTGGTAGWAGGSAGSGGATAGAGNGGEASLPVAGRPATVRQAVATLGTAAIGGRPAGMTGRAQVLEAARWIAPTRLEFPLRSPRLSQIVFRAGVQQICTPLAVGVGLSMRTGARMSSPMSGTTADPRTRRPTTISTNSTPARSILQPSPGARQTSRRCCLLAQVQPQRW